jgi:hypothetical protein
MKQMRRTTAATNNTCPSLQWRTTAEQTTLNDRPASPQSDSHTNNNKTNTHRPLNQDEWTNTKALNAARSTVRQPASAAQLVLHTATHSSSNTSSINKTHP